MLLLLMVIQIATTSANDEKTESIAECGNSKIELLGAGSALPAPLLKEIGPAYTTNRSFYGRKVSFRYIKRNSAYGVNRILRKIKGEPPVLFSASESLMTQAQSAQNRGLKSFPFVAGATMIMFNLPGITDLIIDTQDLARIFMGDIVMWNDPALRRVNPNVKLPNEKILTVGRADDDADTEIFTAALSRFDPAWAKRFGRFSGAKFVNGRCCNSTTWPPHIMFFGNTITGMSGIVASIRYAIGYGALSDAGGLGLKIAALINRMGSVVKPTTKAIQAAMDYHLRRSYGSVTFELSDAKDPDAYPICAFTYMIINISTTKGLSCCQMEELAGFLDWIMFDKRTRIAAERNNVARLSESVANEVLRGTLRAVTCQGLSVYDSYKDSLKDGDGLQGYHYGIIFASSILFASVVAISIVVFYRKFLKLTDENLWLIQSGELKMVVPDEAPSRSSRNSSSRQTNCSSGRSDPLSPGGASGSLRFMMEFAIYDDHEVMLYKLETDVPKRWRGKTKREVLKLRNTILHSNLLTLIGITMRDNCSYAVYEAAPKGTLHELLRTSKLNLIDTIKFNFAIGITDAMKFLHKKKIIHGLLSSLTIYVNRSWSVKIALWDYVAVHSRENMAKLESKLKSGAEGTDAATIVRLLYIDPETRFSNLREIVDVYPFGLLLIEIFTGKLPFRINVEELDNGVGRFTYLDVIREKFFTHGKLLPRMPKGMPTTITDVVYQCIGDAKTRPSYVELSELLEILNPTEEGIIEIMMGEMQRYTKNLEKTNKELKKLTGKMKDLLHEILPPQIADKLYRGESVPPEFFDCATVCFTDIVGFTAISSMSTPQEVMGFLNDLWIMFDKTVGSFDVYKVDTIGDAYMVCSGLPERNGNDHVREIAILSLQLLKRCDTFKIKHMPDTKLKIRLGFNSGSVMTGVVGTKLPQYCVFGEAVNVASKMEQTSQPLRIHLAQKSYDLLTKHYPEFELEYRGTIDFDNICSETKSAESTMKTYWLKNYTSTRKTRIVV